ncbi:MAG: DUF2461 domain-containing protein [Planctomycetota bacterium]
MPAHFSEDLFQYLRSLARNNSREWFLENKARYEQALRLPAQAFIADFAPKLQKIAPAYVADPRPVGGSLFRIHRDTRFSKDKTPYKTHCGIQFRHRHGKDVHAPGFYLHLEPKRCFVGAGLWHPETKVQRAIREAITEKSEAWKRITRGKTFQGTWRLEGESLKRPPRGFDADHPMIEDLKRKDFIAVSDLTAEEACSDDFLQSFTARCRSAVPFMKLLCEATEMDW